MTDVSKIWPAEWPTGHRIALFPHQGDVAAVAAVLADDTELTPMVMRVESGVRGAPSPPGDLLLLPANQVSHWESALDVCGGQPERAAAYLRGRPREVLTNARRIARIEALSTDAGSGEVAAFDVLVNGAYVGQWIEWQAATEMLWIPDGTVAVQPCGGDAQRIEAAVRPVIPAQQLLAPNSRQGQQAPPFKAAELSLLDPRERQVLRMRYGIAGTVPHSLNAVGQRFNVGAERARQIQNAALSKIRRHRTERAKRGA